MSSPFTSYDGWSAPRGGQPAPGRYTPAPYAYRTRECQTGGSGNTGKIVLIVLLAPVALVAAFVLLCVLAVTGPVSVPLLAGAAVAFLVIRPKRGTGNNRPAPARPAARRRGRPAKVSTFNYSTSKTRR